MSQKHVFYTFHIKTNRLKHNYFPEKFLPFDVTTGLGRWSLDKSDKLVFSRNSAGRQIRAETTRKLKFSDFVNKRYLCKASKDSDDRAVIAIARE